MIQVAQPEIERVLVSEAAIEELVAGLAAQLDAAYAELAGPPPVLVGVLTGAAVFTADLARQVTFPVALDFVGVSSYGNAAVSSGTVTWSKRPSLELAGRHVILLEDIVDTGESLVELQREMAALHPASLATCALLSKPARRTVDAPVEYLGLEIPDEFVVGYGLDWAQRFRNLPYVGVLRREVYA